MLVKTIDLFTNNYIGSKCAPCVQENEKDNRTTNKYTIITAGVTVNKYKHGYSKLQLHRSSRALSAWSDAVTSRELPPLSYVAPPPTIPTANPRKHRIHHIYLTIPAGR